MIIGFVCLSQEEYAVGTVVVLIGVCFVVGGFWYRGRLIHRGWKKVGQGLAKEFKKMGDKYAGISYEFHVQGHHKLNKIGGERKKRRRKRTRAPMLIQEMLGNNFLSGISSSTCLVMLRIFTTSLKTSEALLQSSKETQPPFVSVKILLAEIR